jgi:predicted heme/steroid binding protein/uncharacterized membrane protein
MSDQKVFTRDELKTYDGKDGRPIYIAYKGKVYDVSASKLWKTGMHMRRHPGGLDLTSELAAAPHKEEVFDRVPLVGVLEPEPEAVPFPHLPRFLATLLDRYPFFERHPHPMTVHFPIVFMFAAPVFAALYLLTGYEGFELTSVHTLGAGVLFTLVGMVTGFLTWWVNYMARPQRAVVIKIFASLLMLVVSSVAFVWRLRVPTLLTEPSGPRAIYAALLASLVVLVSVLGWFGASLTFPLPSRDKDTSPK